MYAAPAPEGRRPPAADMAAIRPGLSRPLPPTLPPAPPEPKRPPRRSYGPVLFPPYRFPRRITPG
ncbi:hypothetical protein ACKS0A_05545 [Histoplasma ohiense]